MNIGQFNARGPHNGVENWFDLIHDELERQGHEVRQFWLRGKQPTKEDKDWMDFALYHFSQVALQYMRLGVPYCILPSSNDCLPDRGAKLNIASSHKNCKFVTHQSMFHLNKYKEWHIPKPKVYVPMPIRIDLFKPSKKLGNGIIAGGRFVAKKGLHQLSSVDNLTVFGTGPLEYEIKKALPNAKFLGWISDDELKDLMNDSWLFLSPSIVTREGDSEGIANVVKEAMVMKLQVITSSVAGMKELENVTHLDDWSKINDVIDKIPKQPNWKGRQEILKTYSPKVCVNMLLDGIKEYG